MNTKFFQEHLNTSGAQVTRLAESRLELAKAAFSNRNVDLSSAKYLLSGDVTPQPGDLVLARVLRLGQHRRIELATGRRAHLYPSDEVILCYGNRYAPDQFEGQVPSDLRDCHMVAAGGVASVMVQKHGKVKSATSIRPIGLLADDSQRRLNLKQSVISRAANDLPEKIGKPLVLAIVGTSMNAGKTTMAADAIHGLKKAGLSACSLKLTGTASGCDLWMMRDAGAWPVYDFTDAGYISTYRCFENELKTITDRLMSSALHSGADVIVIELADGLLQRETSLLLQSDYLEQYVDGLLFAAADSLGADAGVNRLIDLGLPLIGIGGRMTASPLGKREIEEITHLPVYTSQDLHATSFLHDLKACRDGSYVRNLVL